MRQALESIRRGWERFWFAPESAGNLAAARIIVSAQALWVLLSRDYAGMAGLPSGFWSQVPESARARFLFLPGHPGAEQLLQWLAIIALTGALLGIRARTCCLVAGLLLYHLAPLEALIWTTAPYIRGQTLAILFLLILAVSRCDDALALYPAHPSRVERSWRYSWPLRLMQALLAEVYLFSGLAKLRYAGMAWADPSSLRYWLLRATHDPEWTVYRKLGSLLADSRIACLLVGWGTIALELGFVAALFSRRARRWLVPVALLFHLGIVFSMNLTFVSAPLLLLFWNWEWLEAKWAKPRRRLTSTTDLAARGSA